MDAKLVFCEAKAVTAAATSDAIDFGQTAPTTGLDDRQLFAVVTFPTALAGTGATLQVKLQDSADGKAFADVLSTAAITAADLAAQKSLVLPLPVKHKRYLRLSFTPAGTPTAGTATAFITDAISLPLTYRKVGIEFLQTADPA